MKSGFSYLKLAAVLVVCAIALLPSQRESKATNVPASAAFANADVASEKRVLAKYSDDLFAYEKECAQLGKRARLVNADLDAIQRRSDDLKGRLSEVQGAIREIVKKLKAANEWDDLDTKILSRVTDARDKSFFEQNSFKKLLEDSSNSLSSYGSDVSVPLDNLRKKLASHTASPNGDVQIVKAGYVVSAPYTRLGLACVMANLRLGIGWAVDGREESGHQNARICACSGGTAATCTNATT
jgi:small-conductance mechanosensitive channel